LNFSNNVIVDIMKNSDKQYFAISMPILFLLPGFSDYLIRNVTFANSSLSFLQMS